VSYNEKLECGPMPIVMDAQPNIGGAVCKSSVIPFRVPRRKVWLTPAAGVPAVTLPIYENARLGRNIVFGSRPSDHYFRSVCLSVCLFDCAEFFSAVFDAISIKLGHMLYIWV